MSWLPITAIAAILLLLALYYMPISYRLTANSLVIRRPFSTKEIPFSTLKCACPVEGYFSFYTPASIPTMNTRGFGGFLGKTANGHTSYATNVRHNIWIELKTGKKILLSIQKAEKFLAQLNKELSSKKTR